MNSWKSGKFLPLTYRPWSLNTYCLPKLWYRTACLDLRVGDRSAITSNVKSRLYQDMLVKPQEMVMYRQVELMGVSVINVQNKAMTMLISSCFGTGDLSMLPTNIYHNLLYRCLRIETFLNQARLHTTLPLLFRHQECSL